MAITLKQLLDAGERHAREVLLKSRQKMLMPFYHLVTADANFLVPVQFNGDFEKDLAVLQVKTLAREKQAIMAMFVAESWMAVYDQNYDPETSPRPSQHKDRVEVVMLTATDGNSVEGRVLRMVRDKRNRITGLEVRDDSPSRLTGGRMIDGRLTGGRMIDGIIQGRVIN